MIFSIFALGFVRLQHWNAIATISVLFPYQSSAPDTVSNARLNRRYQAKSSDSFEYESEFSITLVTSKVLVLNAPSSRGVQHACQVIEVYRSNHGFVIQNVPYEE